MRCLQGVIPGLADPAGRHLVGHQIGALFKQQMPARYYAFATLFRDVSKLAQVNPHEAFAEGFILTAYPNHVNGQILKRSVSQVVSRETQAADPEQGAPDLILVK